MVPLTTFLTGAIVGGAVKWLYDAWRPTTPQLATDAAASGHDEQAPSSSTDEADASA